MDRFYKYLTVGETEKNWGLYLTGAGNVKIGKNVVYPLIDDPSHHYFHWSVGRRLYDYQILYITNGEGVFESELTKPVKIMSGSVFILFPGIWHRFKANPKTGWDEYWIEFNGDLVKHFTDNGFLDPGKPVMEIGIQEGIIITYLKTIELIKESKPGFQFLASGNLMQILGEIFAALKYKTFEGKQIEEQIKQAKLTIYENLNANFPQKEIAKRVGLGYSLYRKKFKEYTGVSPAQYQIDLKIHKAKELLTSTKLSLKEIALNLGFESSNYFFRAFKNKTGQTPSDFREKNKR